MRGRMWPRLCRPVTCTRARDVHARPGGDPLVPGARSARPDSGSVYRPFDVPASGIILAPRSGSAMSGSNGNMGRLIRS